MVRFSWNSIKNAEIYNKFPEEQVRKYLQEVADITNTEVIDIDRLINIKPDDDKSLNYQYVYGSDYYIDKYYDYFDKYIVSDYYINKILHDDKQGVISYSSYNMKNNKLYNIEKILKHMNTRELLKYYEELIPSDCNFIYCPIEKIDEPAFVYYIFEELPNYIQIKNIIKPIPKNIKNIIIENIENIQYNNNKHFRIEKSGIYVNIENGDIKIPLQFVKILDYSKENSWYKKVAFERLAENNINIVEYINKK